MAPSSTPSNVAAATPHTLVNLPAFSSFDRSICHDFLGTEMGVAVITALVWLSPNWMPDQEALRAGKDP